MNYITLLNCTRDLLRLTTKSIILANKLDPYAQLYRTFASGIFFMRGNILCMRIFCIMILIYRDIKNPLYFLDN